MGTGPKLNLSEDSATYAKKVSFNESSQPGSTSYAEDKAQKK
jgi:hypothetical protein